VRNEWLSATEASDQLINLNKHSHLKFSVRCDYCISNKCRKEYAIEYRRYLKVLRENNDKIICIFCSRKLKFSNRNNPNTKYKTIDDNFFKSIDTEEKAYLLGWVASDGHIGKRGFKISIGQKDIKILKQLKNIICPQVPIRKFTSDKSQMCSFEINSQEISIDLCRILSIKPGKKSNVINFPNIDEKFIWHFIRGYFDGDGSLNDPDKSSYPFVKGNIRSNSDMMLHGIKNFTGAGSISCNMLCLSNKAFMGFLDSMYTNANLKLKRKYKRYTKWKSK